MLGQDTAWRKKIQVIQKTAGSRSENTFFVINIPFLKIPRASLFHVPDRTGPLVPGSRSPSGAFVNKVPSRGGCCFRSLLPAVAPQHPWGHLIGWPCRVLGATSISPKGWGSCFLLCSAGDVEDKVTHLADNVFCGSCFLLAWYLEASAGPGVCKAA